MGRSCVLVVDSALQTAIPDLLVQWEHDRTVEGWNVLPRLLSPADPSALKNLLSNHPADHVFLAGDSLPYQMGMANPDGHGSRLLPMDGMLTSGAVGRLNFKLQSNLNSNFRIYSKQMYREYFQRRHAWSKGSWILYHSSLCPVIDYFATQYPSIGESYRKSIPTDIYQNENQDPASKNDGGIWTKWHTTAPITAITSSGGMDPGWLWNCGHTHDWFWKAIAVPIAFFFGSHMLEIQQDNSIMMGALASKHTLATFHPYLFTSRVGAKFSGLFDGSKTVGDLGRDFRIASASKYGFVGGDPTLALPTPQQRAQIRSDHERIIADPKASSTPPHHKGKL